MFAFKKVFAVGAALAALAVPTLAFADDCDDHARVEHVQYRDGGAIERLRNQIARERAELVRDERGHRWNEVNRDRMQIARHQRELRELTRGRGRR